MQNWPTVVIALERSPESLARSTRRLRRLMHMAVVLVLLLYLVILVSGAFALSLAWESSDPRDWLDFWRSATGILTLLGISTSYGTWRTFLRTRATVSTLRQAAIARDDTRAPVAAKQPAALDDTALRAGTDAIGPIRRPSAIRGTAALLMAIICFTLGGPMGISAIVILFVYVVQHSVGLLVALLATALPASLLVWLGIIAARRRWRWSCPLTVNVSEIGLSWREPLDSEPERTIPWREAEAFVTFYQRDSMTYARTEAYALISATDVFMWQRNARPTSEEQSAHHALAGAVVARTGLPLRDLTAGVTTVADGRNSTRTARTSEITFPLGTPGSLDAVPGLTPSVVTPGMNESGAASHSRKSRLGCVVALLLLLPAMLLYGGGFVLQRYQPQYFGALLSHIHAETPLYRDTLASPDDDWPNATAAQGPYYDGKLYAGESYLHTGDAYHLKGTESDRLMYWLPGETYGDAVVEVTAREIGTAHDDGVGLIVRVDGSDTNRVTFFVDHTGSWLLSSYHCCHKNPNDDWTALNSGWSVAIYTESGAANTLLIVMRGDTFLCYVNGHYVGAYTQSGVPQDGRVGIYMNTSVTEGIFTNFTVYPLSKGMPLLLV